MIELQLIKMNKKLKWDSETNDRIGVNYDLKANISFKKE
jgi:hypothetical protein